ncbi:uncharacterized protein TNCT_730161 [Trichonephila clavata]|uniref:Uncharacterized protein n=1 Tax=Trichonephila clavata TaxID=2740835 RepID=A0A8X6KBR8_TRICU|nr:uncharacterized protein TNCT_730161 [Trichonephila clavata]
MDGELINLFDQLNRNISKIIDTNDLEIKKKTASEIELLLKVVNIDIRGSKLGLDVQLTWDKENGWHLNDCPSKEYCECLKYFEIPLKYFVQAENKVIGIRGKDENSNFVLIDPTQYFGSYGGIFHSKIIEAMKKLNISLDSSPIFNEEQEIVWWSLNVPSYIGDMSLTKEGRVLVPIDLFYRLKVKHVVLKEAKRISESQNGILNLVREDWKSVLENNPIYQDFDKKKPMFSALQQKEHISLQKVLFNNVLNIVVAGTWNIYFNKNVATIVSNECKPLENLSVKMTHDCENTELSKVSRFFVGNCNPMFCNACRKTRHKLGMELKSDKNQWCILTTKVFDGEKIRNTFKNNIEKDFVGSTFYGILHVEVNQRYFYNTYESNNSKRVKIGGICKEMILFKENCLLPCENLDIDLIICDTNSVNNDEGGNNSMYDEYDFLERANDGEKRNFKSSEEQLTNPKKMKYDNEYIDAIPENLSNDCKLEYKVESKECSFDLEKF